MTVTKLHITLSIIAITCNEYIANISEALPNVNWFVNIKNGREVQIFLRKPNQISSYCLF